MKINQTTFTDKAFTMIEIAIAVGVIGLALVAIIGILPQGMNVQKDNREDTIISQDAPYFLNAIRNGEMRTNNNVFANYVESISVTNVGGANPGVFLYTNPSFTNGPDNYLTNDMNIIGLLSTPEYDFRLVPQAQTNTVSAIVRAMSGSAVEQNGQNSAMAFRYQVTVENVPWNSIASDSIAYNNYLSGSPDYIIRYNRSLEVPYLTNNLHEVRLKFAWPVLPNGTIGPNRQTYRTLVSSHLFFINLFQTTFWFFQPQVYTNNIDL
jgi:hypothetical protein